MGLLSEAYSNNHVMSFLVPSWHSQIIFELATLMEDCCSSCCYRIFLLTSLNLFFLMSDSLSFWYLSICFFVSSTSCPFTRFQTKQKQEQQTLQKISSEQVVDFKLGVSTGQKMTCSEFHKTKHPYLWSLLPPGSHCRLLVDLVLSESHLQACCNYQQGGNYAPLTQQFLYM